MRGHSRDIGYLGDVFENGCDPSIKRLVYHMRGHGADEREIAEFFQIKPLEGLDIPSGVNSEIVEDEGRLLMEKGYWGSVSAQLSEESGSEDEYKFDPEDVDRYHTFTTIDYFSEILEAGVERVRSRIQSDGFRRRDQEYFDQVDQYLGRNGDKNVVLVDRLE